MSVFHWHKWSDWLVTDKGGVFDTFFGRSNVRVGWYVIQQRHCAVCGKTQTSEQATYGGNSPAWTFRISEMTSRKPVKDGVSA